MYRGKLPEGAFTVKATPRLLKPGASARPSEDNLIREPSLAAVPASKQELFHLHIKKQAEITRKTSKE